MMLSCTSGKMGYSMYQGGKATETEEKFSGKPHHGRPDQLLKDVVIPQLRQRLKDGTISFFTLKRDNEFDVEKDSQNYWQNAEPFVVEAIGAPGESIDSLPSGNRVVVTASGHEVKLESANKDEVEYFNNYAGILFKHWTR